MTQEEKQLLLKDLCARLPYGVIAKVTYSFNNETTFGEDVITSEDYEIECINQKKYTIVADGDINDIDEVKPYLRPMSSMTKEEVFEYLSACNRDNKDTLIAPKYFGLDYLLSHHLDYRGLIPMGLALEAKEGMYKF